MSKRRKSRSVRAREGRLSDPGPDAGGRYSPSPWALQGGHIVEDAPRELRANPDSSFPKRIATQRMLDRYLARRQITDEQWQAGNALWLFWVEALLEERVTSGYGLASGNGANQDSRIARRIDSAGAFVELLAVVPYRSRGVVRVVVIEDQPASNWASDSAAHAMGRLRAGLSALAQHFGY